MKVFPGATVIRGTGGVYVGGPFRGVLHTTEGDSAQGAIDSFQADGYWPHFTVTFEDAVFRVYQHLDIENEAAAALEHRHGTCQTNNQSAVQIECVGHAASSHSWSAGYLEGLASLMRWIEATVGVHPMSTVRWSATDVGDDIRMSESEWLAYQGWCGHCHVPHQEHWDPGAPNIAALLPPAVNVVADGTVVPCPAFLENGEAWVGLRAAAAAIGVGFSLDGATASFDGHSGTTSIRTIGDTGYIPARALPAAVAYHHGVLTLTSQSCHGDGSDRMIDEGHGPEKIH